MRKNIENIISKFLILYFMLGLLFAFLFAWFYHWPAYSFFSPRFFEVAFTWPYQSIGFIPDLLTYGLAGKPLSD